MPDVNASLSLLDPSSAKSAKQILSNIGQLYQSKLCHLVNDLLLEPEALGIDNCKGADMKFIMVELNEATVSVASNTSSIHRLQ